MTGVQTCALPIYLPIAQEVKDALLYHDGRCGVLYDLVLSYERADWAAIGDLADTLEIPVNLLTNTYFQCLGEVNSIWKQLTETSDGLAPEPAPTAT